MACVDNPNNLICKIEMLSKMRKKILHDFNDTYADYPREKTIHQLFEEQLKNVDTLLLSEDNRLL